MWGLFFVLNNREEREKNNREEKTNAANRRQISNFVYCLLPIISNFVYCKSQILYITYKIHTPIKIYTYKIRCLCADAETSLNNRRRIEVRKPYLSVSIAEDVDKINKIWYNIYVHCVFVFVISQIGAAVVVASIFLSIVYC